MTNLLMDKEIEEAAALARSQSDHFYELAAGYPRNKVILAGYDVVKAYEEYVAVLLQYICQLKD